MPTPDPQLHRIRRAFDAAFGRMITAASVDDLEDELSNMLHHLYRLGELCRWRLSQVPGEQLSKEDFGKELLKSDDLRAARAAMWVRNDDTHNLFKQVTAPVAMGDGYSDYYTEMYGALVWQPLSKPDAAGRDKDYADTLKDDGVLETMRRAFDAMAALL